MMMVCADVMHRCRVSGIARGDQQAQGQSRTQRIFSYRATTGSCVMRGGGTPIRRTDRSRGMTVTGGLECAIKPTVSW